MSHLIPADDVERLATLNGVPRFQDWAFELDNADTRMQAQLGGTVEQDWESCLPTWLNLGRVKDRSRGIRAPHYWPYYATNLGYRFASVHRDHYSFLATVAENEHVRSIEYLCAFDLLYMIASQFDGDGLSVPGELFAIATPVPVVVSMENQWDPTCRGINTFGEMLRYLRSLDD